MKLFVVIAFGVISLFFAWFGYGLVKLGAAGDWQISSNWQGWRLYITSISPGLFVMLLGATIICYGLPKTLKSL